MSRSSRKRTSRALIGVMVCTIVLGSVFYFRNASKAKAAQGDAAQADPTPAPNSIAKAPADGSVAPEPVVAPAKPAPPVPLVTVTPTGPVNPSSTPGAATPSSSLASKVPAAPGQPKPVVLALNTNAPSPLVPSTRPANAPTQTGVPSMADAKAKLEAGQLLAARNAYSAALASGMLPPSDEKLAKLAIADINKVVVFSPRRFAEDPWGGSYVVRPGDRMQKIAAEHGTTWELLCKINNMSDPRKLRAGQTLKLVKGPFHATVSKSAYTMDVYLGAPGGPGSQFVTSFPVGLGADDSTPTGTWLVEPQKKIKNPTYFSPRGEGVIDADDPKNPLGDYWLGLTGVDGQAVGKQSYGIHGTIEPDSIGKMASMGCIRLINENVAQVFDLLVEGKSTVIVRE